MDAQAQRTLKWDLLRSFPLGLLESIATTFGVLILVRVFDGDQWEKALVVASSQLGLLFSLLLVQLIRRSGISAGKAMAALHVFSAIGFGIIAVWGDLVWVYVIGILIGAIGLANSIPLMSQVYRQHFPDKTRGKLFAYGGIVRKLAAILAALAGGWLLEKDISNFKILFGIFSGASLLMAFFVLQFDEVILDRTKTTKLFRAFRHFKKDKEFRDLLISWMFLGFGNLMNVALFVEYISNRTYGYDLSEFTIGMVTTFVPEAAFLVTVIWWGKLFDRWNFYFLRASLNLLFAFGILIYFLGHGIWFLVIGIAIHGIAKAGGNVAWSLWVTKFSKPEHVAEYMSVHTFLTGCRGLIAPFISLPLALIFSPQSIAIIGSCLMIIATIMISPNIHFGKKRREGKQVDLDPRN